MTEGAMALGKNTLETEKMMGYIQRIEAEDKLKQVHADNITAIKAEAKASGFLPKALGAIVTARKMKPSAFRENEDLRDLYFHAAGLAEEPPLFKQIASLAGDDMGRHAVIESMKKLVPVGGSIIVEMEGAPVKITRAADGSVTVEQVKPRPPGGPAGSPMPSRPTVDVPNVTKKKARELGAEAFDQDEPITANPFPFGHENQPEWDAGWRKRSGGDGMGPDT